MLLSLILRLLSKISVLQQFNRNMIDLPDVERFVKVGLTVAVSFVGVAAVKYMML